MQTITLEEHVLDASSETAKIDARPLLSNLELELDSNLKSKEEAHSALNNTKRVVGIYGGVFNTLASKINSSENPEFIRSYFSYIASCAVVSLIQGNQTSDKARNNNSLNNNIFNIPFNVTDRSALMGAIKSLTNYLATSFSLSAIDRNTNSFFASLSDYVLAKINHPRFSELRKKYQQIGIKGPNFEISGLEEVLVQEKGKTPKGLTPFYFNTIKREDIIGNAEAVRTAESSINCLMHYSDNKNPFFGFDQFLAFLGKPGTGKSMAAIYAMGLAKTIAEQYNIPISISELNFEDSFQYGPLVNLRTQLQEISKGDKIHIIFADEFDSKLPSRNSLVNSSYKSEVVGEFLRFRGGAYPNKGNYLFLITSNNPSGIDPAMFRVFNPIYVSGPRTADEKLEVLQKNLSKGATLGYVQIKNWQNILSAVEDTNLTGADLSKIASWAEEKFRSISSTIPFNLSLDAKSKLIREKAPQYTTTEQDVLNAISQYQYSREMGDESYV